MCNIPLHKLKEKDYKGFFHTVVVIWAARLAGKYKVDFLPSREDIDVLYKQIYEGEGGEKHDNQFE